MSEKSSVAKATIRNGIDVTEYESIVEAVREDPTLAKFEFRAANVWDGGGLNRTTITAFYGAGEVHGEDGRRFVVEAAEPPVLLGKDEAPNPAEYLLHSLAACLTSSIIYKAASRGIVVESVEAKLEGDLDARSFLELSDEERRGYREIRAEFRVRSSASEEEIRELMEFSPVLDVVRHGTPVSLRVAAA
jgi:uncharacterized OsmC-like protein